MSGIDGRGKQYNKDEMKIKIHLFFVKSAKNIFFGVLQNLSNQCVRCVRAGLGGLEVAAAENSVVRRGLVFRWTLVSARCCGFPVLRGHPSLPGKRSVCR